MTDDSDNHSASSSYIEQIDQSSSTDRDGESRRAGAGSVNSTTGSGTSGTKTNLSKEETTELAATESRAVRNSKICFIAILLVVAAAAGTATFVFLKKEDQNSFTTEVSGTSTSSRCDLYILLCSFDTREREEQ
jgi:hypothetical protein